MTKTVAATPAKPAPTPSTADTGRVRVGNGMVKF